MNYIEKVQYMIDREKKEGLVDEYYIDVVEDDIAFNEEYFNDVVKNYDYIPLSYKNFIRHFNCIGLSFVSFYGANSKGGLTLGEEIEEFYPYLGTKYFPFAKDADGSVYVFDENGAVKLFDIYDYEFQKEPEHIADNFESFIDDYLLGSAYDGNLDEDNTFGIFLKKMGWIK